MDGRTWKQYTPPQTKFAGGIIILQLSLNTLIICSTEDLWYYTDNKETKSEEQAGPLGVSF